VATDFETYFGPGGHPIDAVKIWQGGLGIWGAIALGAVGAWIGCRRLGVPLPFVADAVAPGIVTAQAIGRLGNYFNQELTGGPTTLPWGLELYSRDLPGTSIPDQLNGVAVNHIPYAVVHPTFLYELIWDLLVAVLVVWADRRFRLGHGRAFALYVAGYTLGRFFIEQIRDDPATRVFGDIRINVVVAGMVFLGAVAYLVMMRKPREVLAWPDRAGEHPAADGSDRPGQADAADRDGEGTDRAAAGATGGVAVPAGADANDAADQPSGGRDTDAAGQPSEGRDTDSDEEPSGSRDTTSEGSSERPAESAADAGGYRSGPGSA
jgi:prolipoprotein diacylglyceryl transferase